MTRLPRGVGLVALLLALLAPGGLRAQFPGDTVPGDTLRRDTVDYTARYLEAQERATVRIPTLARLEPPGPLPRGSRVVFDRDSIEWGHAVTVGDLLSQVPGVYLWRGGWFGRPEPVSFQGRGATSAEYYLDGVPYVATGVDSIGVDPAHFSISFLDRMEVERLPGLLRVYLFTRRHDRLAPRSRIAVARGDRDFARYEADLERRFANGLGFSAAADYLSAPTGSGFSSSYSNTQLWLQGGYVPSARFAAQYQLVRSRPNRRPFVSDLAVDDTIGLGYDATRTDAQFRVSLRGVRPGGLGPGLDLIYGRTGWDGEGVDQQVNQLGGYLTYREPTLSLLASGFYRTRWTPLEARARVGWSPAPPLTLAAEGAYQTHRGGRSSRWVLLRAGLQPVRQVTVAAAARLGEAVAAPSVATDPAQRLRDFQGSIAWQGARLGLEAALVRTSAYAPFAYPEFVRVPTLAPAPETEWVTLSARVAPVRWITLEGWYSDPLGTDSPDGLPPTHSVASVTLRSKFLRTFRSGIFDLKLRLAMESWGTGTIGRATDGTPIPLRGATFFRSLIQFQLGGFSVYWDRGNLTASDRTYVPGFRLPAYGSTFGVRWEFLN